MNTANATDDKSAQTNKKKLGAEPRMSRYMRRATMQSQNEHLRKSHAELLSVGKHLQMNNHAMNTLLSDIAGTVGIPIPKTAQEGVAAVERLRDRVLALVEFEKKHKAEVKS